MSTETDGISQEIRYAIVMYGGVSLAIYMNGIAQEMLRLVRSTAVPDPASLSGTEKIYRDLACLLHARRIAGDPSLAAAPRTRFVIDLLAGTSAGGINAVFLAKALARGSRDLDDLRHLWMTEADFDTLLNDKKSTEGGRYPLHQPTQSILNSGRMYGLLRQAFEAMDKESRLDPACAAASAIDLYVTATDLNGLVVPIELTDKALLERAHRSVFHFAYDPERGCDDFTAAYNAMLAFAARCTSSFPAAFEPMQFEKITPPPTAEERQRYKRFFESYTPPGEESDAAKTEMPFSERVFADGGYLNNRPFSYVIDQIGQRTSDGLVVRKLLFVDPFPEHLDQRVVRTDFSFAENGLLAASTLPRYETIRGDLARINDANRLAIRMAEVEEALFALDPTGAKLAPEQMHLGEEYGRRYMDELLQSYGPQFVTDQQLKVSSVSDWVALVATRQMGLNDSGDYYRAIRLLVSAWRRANFASTRPASVAPAPPETEFIRLYDFRYRLSRLRYLIFSIDRVTRADAARFDQFWHALKAAQYLAEERTAQCDRDGFERALALIRQRLNAKLRDLRLKQNQIEARTLGLKPDPGLEPLRRSIAALRLRFKSEDLLNLLRKVDADAQRKAAEDLYRPNAAEAQAFFTELSGAIGRAIADAVGEHDRLKSDNQSDDACTALAAHWLLKLWDSYEVVGNVMARLLPHGQIGESGTVEVFRVGPADTDLTIHGVKSCEEKLAGTALGAFGAFLAEGWRENDIMWGRLDGAERLIVSLMPDERDRELRDAYIGRVRDAILQEEFDPANGRLFRWFAGEVQRCCGAGLSARELTARVGRLKSGRIQSILLALSRSPAQWQPFLKEYYSIPADPPRQKQAEWVARTMRIAGQMIEGLEPVSGIGKKLKLAGSVLLELVLVSVPGSLRNHWFSHLLKLMMLAGVILVVLGAFLSSDFSTVGFRLLLYAGGLWLTIRCLRSWLAGTNFWRGVLIAVGALLVSSVLWLAALGYQNAVSSLRHWWTMLLKLFS